MPSENKRQRLPSNESLALNEHEDIVLSLSGILDEELVLRKRNLARMCDYFAEFVINSLNDLVFSQNLILHCVVLYL